MPKRRLTLGERLDAWRTRNVILVALLLAAVVVSAIVTLAGTGLHIYRWATRERESWQHRETRVIDSLIAGFSLQTFEGRLGVPLFVRHAGGLVENTFARHGYWVQALSERGGTVEMFAVTVCDPSFQPRIARQGGPALTLNKSTLASITGAIGTPQVVLADYFASGATGNSHFYEMTYGGNPSNYKSYAWGIDDACPNWFNYYNQPSTYKLLRWVFRHGAEYKGRPSAPAIQAFRRVAVVNTYAETAVIQKFGTFTKNFQIGVDRILVRTSSPNYYPPLTSS